MRVIIAKNEDAMSKIAAGIIAENIRKKPRLVLGLDVSNTLIGAYNELAAMHKTGKLDFSRVISFNLDEYVGLGHDHPQSCKSFMDKNFFNKVNFDNRNIFIPNGLTKNLHLMCEQYEKNIKEMAGIDLQVLGIGKDGHIGFNESGSSLSSRTRIKTLSEDTVKERSKYFKKKDENPKFAITVGVGTIMESRMCMLLACGKRKTDILVKAIEGPVTTSVPASMLQLHSNVLVVCDEEAGAKLKQKNYYRYVEKMNKLIEVAQI